MMSVTKNESGLQEAVSLSPAASACTTIQAMLRIGPYRLADDAFDEIADHIEVCDTCRASFDLLCPETVADLSNAGTGPGGEDSPSLSKQEDRPSAHLVREV